ncbi:MAG: hypothetical protein OEW15_14830 [Nitrospirota bacterium]|nr:hypothetical protein [Nitrospirota bacterium]
MKRKLIATAIIGMLSIAVFGMLYAQTASYDSSNFNADARKLQPAPTGHTVGKDSGPGEGLHNSGEDCAICHTTNGKAGNYVFTVGGTIYEDRAARRPLKGAEVILQDYAGNVISMTTNDAGNFWTYADIASNPYTVASHSGVTHLLFTVNADGSVTPANPSDSRTWLYKAWIRNPDGAIRQMVTIAPVGGSTGTVPRMSCNMHHSPFGSTGAAWASRKSSLAAYPASSLSFRKHILPIFVSKCAPCHVPGAKATRLVTISDVYTQTTFTYVSLANTAVTSIDYSSGQDFTSYAGSVYTSGSTTVTKQGIKDFVNTSSPDESPLLTKAIVQEPGTTIHAGGSFWKTEDNDYKAIRQWIAEGAQNN